MLDVQKQDGGVAECAIFAPVHHYLPVAVAWEPGRDAALVGNCWETSVPPSLSPPLLRATPATAPPSPRRSLTVAPLIADQRCYGVAPVWLWCGPREDLVQGWTNRRPEAREGPCA